MSSVTAFLGEIRIMTTAYAPTGWAICNGALLGVRTYEALFALLGTTYGGNGRETFGLPDLRGRLPIGAGQRQGASAYPLGDSKGDLRVQLESKHLPAHAHRPVASSVAATLNQGDATTLLASTVPEARIYNDLTFPGTGDAVFAAQAIGDTGDGGAHDNVMPGLVLTYMICLQGVYPSSN